MSAQNIFALNSQKRQAGRRLVRNGKRTVLIVDDEPDITLTLKIGLEIKSYIVDAFNDPVEALSYLEYNSYDIIIIDIMMPDMDGFEFYRRVQSVTMNLRTKPKVCFLTALNIEDYGTPLLRREKFSPTLSDDTTNQQQQTPFIITKPVSVPVLRRLLDEILSNSRLTTVKIKENGQLQEPPTCNYCGAWMDNILKLSFSRRKVIDGETYFCTNPSCAPICADA